MNGEETVTTVGILSDTHLHSATTTFQRQCSKAFNGCEVIIHAGDLTDISILHAFSGKEIHAVCGNTCNRTVQQISAAVRFGVSPADCIIFGHSHNPVCRKIGSTLLINPGSFQGAGRFGAGPSYGLLHIEPTGLAASLHTLSEKP